MTGDTRPAEFGETDMLQAQLRIATLVRTATTRYAEVMEEVSKAADRDAAVAAITDLLDCHARSAKYVLDLQWLRSRLGRDGADRGADVDQHR